MYASASSIGLIVVEVDTVEDLVENAKIERLGNNVPQLIKTGTPHAQKTAYFNYFNRAPLSTTRSTPN